MKALVLAAGYATRLYPLTIDTPKALLPIAGRPMLDYLMDGLASVEGLTEVHLVTNHRFAEAFNRWAKEAEVRYPGLSPVIWDDGTTDDSNKLGAIGDIQYVLDHAHLADDLLIAASDNFFTFPLSDFVADFRRTGKDTLLCAHSDDLEMLRRFAVATVDGSMRVTDLEEKPQEPRSDLAVYALYLYRADTLPLFAQYLAEGNSPDSPGHFPAWLYRRKDVRAWAFTGECIDIGTHASYKEVCDRFSGR